ncbi:hypothetical protein GTY23_17830 [Streptomyces sp. SID5998]|nr:hypothetical protein [Streptomyces sp. SID5998]
MTETGERTRREYTWKAFVLCVVGFCLAGLAAWFGYVQLFTKGLERLPATVCDDTVPRDMVIRVLPEARAADERAHSTGAGADLDYFCQVTTSDDAQIWSRTQVVDVSRKDWLERDGRRGAGGPFDHVASAGVEALASEDRYSGVYIPCTPSSGHVYGDPADYAVVTEVWVSAYDDPAPTGPVVRQTLTDIAYRVARHAYELAGCRAPHAFPAELPRYEVR